MDKMNLYTDGQDESIYRSVDHYIHYTSNTSRNGQGETYVISIQIPLPGSMPLIFYIQILSRPTSTNRDKTYSKFHIYIYSIECTNRQVMLIFMGMQMIFLPTVYYFERWIVICVCVAAAILLVISVYELCPNTIQG